MLHCFLFECFVLTTSSSFITTYNCHTLYIRLIMFMCYACPVFFCLVSFSVSAQFITDSSLISQMYDLIFRFLFLFLFSVHVFQHFQLKLGSDSTSKYTVLVLILPDGWSLVLWDSSHYAHCAVPATTQIYIYFLLFKSDSYLMFSSGRDRWPAHDLNLSQFIWGIYCYVDTSVGTEGKKQQFLSIGV